MVFSDSSRCFLGIVLDVFYLVLNVLHLVLDVFFT